MSNWIASVKDDTGWKNVVLNAPKTTLCVVDVYTEWCGPCTALEKKLRLLKQDGSDTKARTQYSMPPTPHPH